jgi:hypothetical protein
MKLTSLASAVLALAGFVQAQSCGNLAVSGGPTTPVTFTATSLAAEAPAFLVVGPETGTTVFNFGPLGTLTLGLALPFALLPLGATSASGGASLTVDVPPSLPRTDLHAQAFSIEFEILPPPPRLEFCTTNVVAFTIGG